MRKFYSALIASLLAALLPCTAMAQPAPEALSSEITIKDTSGVTRNVTAVEGEGVVEFGVQTSSGAPADGAQITLKNPATGEVMSAVASNGTVIFEGVTPGVWVVASSSADIVFVGISVTPLATAGAGFAGITHLTPATQTVLGGVAAAAAVGGATVAIVESQDDDNNGDDEPLSPFL